MPFPKIEDCQSQMRKSLPQAHKRAIEKAERAISYYQQIASIVESASSLSEINSKLGRVSSRHLDVTWRIDVSPEHRKYANLPVELSRSEIRSQILKPVERIVAVYRDIKAGLSKGDFNYECEYRNRWWYQGCKKGIDGWVDSIFGMRIGDIHICVDEIDPADVEKLSSVIIHEASHKFGKTIHPKKTSSSAGRIKDADSYDDDKIPAAKDWGWVKSKGSPLGYLDEWLGQLDEQQAVSAAATPSNEGDELLSGLGDWLGVHPRGASSGLSPGEKGLLSNLDNWLCKEDEKQREWTEQLVHCQQTWLQEEEGRYQEWINGLVQQARNWLDEERDRWGDIVPAENEGLLSDLGDWFQHQNERQLSHVRQQQEEQFSQTRQYAEILHDRLHQQWLHDWRLDRSELPNTLPASTELLSDLEKWLDRREESLDQQRNQQLSWLKDHQEEQQEWLQQSRQQQNILLANLREHQQDWLQRNLQGLHEGHLTLNQWHADFAQQQQRWQQEWQQQQQQQQRQLQQDWQRRFRS